MNERKDEELKHMLEEELGKHYDLGSACEISLLKYSENYNWLVQTGSKKYVLRLCRPGYHTTEELMGELLWIQELEKSTDIRMPVVIKNHRGELLTQIKEYYCTMFSFLNGTTLRGIEGEELLGYLQEIGQITAKLHRQVQEWPGVKNIVRFTWNYEDLLGKDARVGDWRKHPRLSEEERSVYEKAEQIIGDKLKQYGKTPENYGLIHSDFNINNVLVDQGKVQVLDFDDCGFGWFLYDLSTSVLEYDEGIRDKMAAWLKGYETERKLTETDKAMVPTFIVMRKIVRIGWIASHMENDTVKKVTDNYYEQTYRMAKRYVESDGTDF
ncbi:MAG: phosphotransferase [Lachnospiraceae bacterium]|nr:phosphotransferase [Lachnospiraceae bacterium]